MAWLMGHSRAHAPLGRSKMILKTEQTGVLTNFVKLNLPPIKLHYKY